MMMHATDCARPNEVVSPAADGAMTREALALAAAAAASGAVPVCELVVRANACTAVLSAFFAARR